MDAFERNQIVIDSIKDWIEEKDAYFLAIEGVLVYWESITGDPADSEWHKVTSIEAARVLKATRVNYQLMQYCTGDAVITAAQEMERVYTRGVRSSVPVKEEFFNYVEHEKAEKSVRHRIAHSIISDWRELGCNPQWTMVAGIITYAWSRAGLPLVNAQERNVIMEEVCHEVGYRVCRGTTRYNCAIHGKVGIMKLPNVKYATLEVDENAREEMIVKSIGETYGRVV